MYYTATKVRPALIYLGGKSLLSRRILEFVRDHKTYVEPFCGGLNVLLNKHRSEQEVAGDLNHEIIKFYRYLSLNSGLLKGRLREIFSSGKTDDVEYLRGLFFQSLDPAKTDDPLERSISTIIKYQMSRNGDGRCFFMPLDPVSAQRHREKWTSLIEALDLTAERMQGVEFRHQSAFDLIPEMDSPSTVFYVDPPYYPLTRVGSNSYQNELTPFEHVTLLRLLKSCQGQVILSGYPSPIYDEELKGWGRYEFDLKCSSAQSAGSIKKDRNAKKRITEVLWVKPYWPF